MFDELVPHLDHVPVALLVIFRLGGIVVFGPLVSMPAIPARVRVMLAFILGLAAYPVLAAGPLRDVAVPLDPLLLGPLILMEVSLGALVGFLASLPLLAAQMGGLVMGQQMGLGFALFYDPTLDEQTDVLGQILYLLVLAGFIAVGGLEAMYAAVLGSFDHVPLGGFRADLDLAALLGGLLLSAFEFALRISAPLLALIFLETVAMGFLARTVPQLNILSLGFPVRILAGIFVVGAGLVAIEEVLLEGVDHAMRAVDLWIATR